MHKHPSSLAGLAEIFQKLAEISTFYKGALIFPIGGTFLMKIWMFKGSVDIRRMELRVTNEQRKS